MLLGNSQESVNQMSNHNQQFKSKLVKSRKNFNRTSLAIWLFLIGSLMFLIDGFIELSEGISIHVLLHLSASILFVIGSVFFIPTGNHK